MYAREENKSIKTYNQIPAIWNNDFAFKKRGEAVHKEAGFYPVVITQYNTATQRRVNLHFDEVNEVFTYDVEDKSTEELQNEKISNAQFQKEELVRKISEEKIIAEAQEETDDALILANQALYPLWSDMPDGFEFEVEKKYQDFVDGELKAFRVLQAHNKQADYNPVNVPALFAKVNLPGQIEDWEERTGENTYKIGDKVYWPIGSTIVYRSTINNNSWSPVGYPAGWELVTV